MNNKRARYAWSKSNCLQTKTLNRGYDKGATLIFSLLILIVILLLGTSLANIALIGEKSSRNEHDRLVAMLAAESALADAETDIENAATNVSRSAMFSPKSNAGFIEGCGKGDANIYQGLCFSNETTPMPLWNTVNIADTGANSISVKFGRFTGRTMPVGQGALPCQLPRYIIELMPDYLPGQAADAPYLYRITAIGFGMSRTTQAVVQSVYRKSL